MSDFDYTDTDVSDDVVRSVAADIKGHKPGPLTESERLERSRWREESHQRHLEQEAEREHRQAIADEAARQEAAAEIAESNRQKRLQQQREYQDRAEQRSRGLDLSILRNEAQAQSNWRNLVQSSLWHKQTQAILDDMYRMVNPPPPSPELQGLDELREELADLKGQLEDRLPKSNYPFNRT